MDAVATGAAKIAQEKMLPVSLGQAGAWIVGQARRAVGDDGDGRNDKGGLAVPLRIAEALAQPRAARVGLLDELKADAPAAVAALGYVHPAGRITGVGVIIAGPKIAVLIEDEFLRIAEA